MKARILIVDDERDMCDLLRADLGQRGAEVRACRSAVDALQTLAHEEFDVVLADVNMPEMSGIDLCDRIASSWPDIPVVIITAFGSLETAIAAIRAGAYDFVQKPIEMELLALTLDRAFKHRRLREDNRILRETVEHSHEFQGILGASPPMVDLCDRLGRVGGTDSSVLVTGESGTGKELVARALHEMSPRRAGRFIAVNCGAFPETLLESELFGHERGAFTGAHQARPGLMVQADGGTLFLDEMGDLPLTLQPKLLRALEQRSVRPLGGDHERPFDARLVTATNRDLEAAVDEGRFREDLFYRVNVIQLVVPPLRARGADVLLLAHHFLKLDAARTGKNVTGISHAAAAKLMDYSWPGNVRELRNAMEHAVALTRHENLTLEDLPERIRAFHRSHVLVESRDPGELAPLEEVERRYIRHVLEAVGGNRTTAARVLGLDRKTLYRKLKNNPPAGD